MIGAFSKLKCLSGGSEGGGDTWGRWQKPREYEIKVNVDGSSIQALMHAGVGCAIRDSHGK